MHQPKWVLNLKKKATQKKLTPFLICIPAALIVFLIAGVVDGGFNRFVTETGLVAGAITLGVFLLIAILLAANVKLRVRHYNGNVICFYNTLMRGQLFINGELFDEGGMFDYTLYGQLPTGEEVVLKADPWTGSISFHIGSTTNNQSILLL